MLNGLEPVIIFQFGALVPGQDYAAAVTSVPIISMIPTIVEEPPIPIYLSDKLTGLFIDSEDKTVDIQTDFETKTDGSESDVNQKGISNMVSISILARKDSLGLTLLSAMANLVFEKATSKEYSVTYLHGPITVFRGLINTFTINQNADNDLAQIRIELTSGTKTPVKPSSIFEVPSSPGALPPGITS